MGFSMTNINFSEFSFLPSSKTLLSYLLSSLAVLGASLLFAQPLELDLLALKQFYDQLAITWWRPVLAVVVAFLMASYFLKKGWRLAGWFVSYFAGLIIAYPLLMCLLVVPKDVGFVGFFIYSSYAAAVMSAVALVVSKVVSRFGPIQLGYSSGKSHG